MTVKFPSFGMFSPISTLVNFHLHINSQSLLKHFTVSLFTWLLLADFKENYFNTFLEIKLVVVLWSYPITTH